MKKKITLLLAVIFMSILAIANPYVSSENNIKVYVHEPVELLFTIYHLTPDAEKFIKSTKRDRVWVDAMIQPLIQSYQDYKKHEAVEAMMALASEYDEWLPLLVNIGIQNERLPLNPSLFQPEKNTDYAKAVRHFIALANDFYKDSQFKQRFKANQPIYKAIVAEVKHHLPECNFINTMETFYQESFLSYNLCPSPLLPAGNGMGFGPHWKTAEGTKVFNVFSGVDEPKVHPTKLLKTGATFGFNNENWVRGICTHEFGHSFVNEQLFVYRDQFMSYQALQKPIKKAMKKQGYWYWDGILAEHLVRVGEIRIADRLGLKEASDDLYYDYYINRKFIYLPHLLEVMRAYEEKTEMDSFKAFLPEIIASLEKVDVKQALKDWKKAKKLTRAQVKAPSINAIHPTKSLSGQYAGDWKYEVTNTPYGNFYGHMKLYFNNGNYTGVLENNLGGKFEMTNLQLDGQQLTFDTNIENTSSKVKGNFNGDNFSGKVQVIGEDAPFKLNALRVVVTEKKATTEIPIITKDIDLFWACYDKAKPNFEVKYFEEYLEKGSQGVKDFTPYRIKSAKDLAQKVKENTAAYEAIRTPSLKIKSSFTEEVEQIYQNLQEVYDEAVFAPAYFVIGRFNSGGTASSNGIIMGAEMVDKIGFDNIPGIVAHELIHFQQKYPNSYNLLSQCINEGSADLLGLIIHKKPLKHKLDDWCLPRAKAIWSQFQKDKLNEELGGWLYGGEAIPGSPVDVGYWIGYQIAKAYYDKQVDKKQAIRDILHIQDFDKFLKESGYGQQFE